MWNVRCFIFLIFCTLLYSCGDSNFMDRTRIDGAVMGGENVSETDVLTKQVVFLAQNYEFDQNQTRPEFFGLCTAVVVARQFVLTAAHCVQNKKSLRIIMTSNIHDDYGYAKNTYKVQTSIIHPEYNAKAKNRNDYDLALVLLDRPLTDVVFDHAYFTQQPADSYSEPSTPNSIEALVAGFGRTTALKSTQNLNTAVINGILKKAPLEISANILNKKTFVIDQKDKNGVCSGDSGAPLFVMRNQNSKLRYLQALAVAVSEGDDKIDFNMNLCNGQAIFLNIDFHKDWIHREMLNLNFTFGIE